MRWTNPEDNGSLFASFFFAAFLQGLLKLVHWDKQGWEDSLPMDKEQSCHPFSLLRSPHLTPFSCSVQMRVRMGEGQRKNDATPWSTFFNPSHSLGMPPACPMLLLHFHPLPSSITDLHPLPCSGTLQFFVPHQSQDQPSNHRPCAEGLGGGDDIESGEIEGRKHFRGSTRSYVL